MRMPVVEIGRRMLASLHEQGFDDLIPAHLIVLRWPGPDGKRPVEVAERTGMSKQALNYLLGQLEEAGYLERVEDPDDRRSKRIRTTKRGVGPGPCDARGCRRGRAGIRRRPREDGAREAARAPRRPQRRARDPRRRSTSSRWSAQPAMSCWLALERGRGTISH